MLQKKQWDHGQGGYTVQAAIGQLNNAFTPLQMVKYVGMIANGGHNLDVTLIKSIKMQMEAKFQKMKLMDMLTKNLV